MKRMLDVLEFLTEEIPTGWRGPSQGRAKLTRMAMCAGYGHPASGNPQSAKT
jgi:hypothetical protein